MPKKAAPAMHKMPEGKMMKGKEHKAMAKDMETAKEAKLPPWLQKKAPAKKGK